MDVNTKFSETKIWYNLYHRDPIKYYEKNDGKSMTSPGQAMSIKDVMERAQAGIPVPVADNGMYYLDNEDEIVGHEFDLTDIDMEKERLQVLAQAKLKDNDDDDLNDNDDKNFKPETKTESEQKNDDSQ